MRVALHSVLAFLAATLSITVLPTIAGHIPVPNLVLIGCGLAVFANDRQAAWVWALVGGLILDLASAGRPMYTLFFLTFVSIVFFLIDRHQAHQTGMFMLGAGVMSIAALVTLEAFVGGRPTLEFTALAFLVNACAFGLAYWLFRDVFRRHAPTF